MKYRIAVGPSSFAEEDPAPLSMLEAAGCEVVPNPYGRRLTEPEIIAHLAGIDGLVAGLEPLNRRVLDAAPQLKVIARVGIGMTNVDIEAARERRIKVSNTPEGPTNAVAEMTVAALLALARQLIPTNAALHRHEWKKIMGKGLRGLCVLIVGYGRIGRRAAQLMGALGCRITVYDPYVDLSTLPDGFAAATSLSEGLAVAEVVSLHAVGTDCILGRPAFEVMRDGIILLNGARGELVHEQALVDALESGKVSAAWLDAFWEEPYTGPLTKYDQVLLTPHVGTYTRQCRRDMETAAVENLLRDLGERQGERT